MMKAALQNETTPNAYKLMQYRPNAIVSVLAGVHVLIVILRIH